MKLRWILGGGAVVLLALLGVAFAMRGQISLALMQRAIAQGVQGDVIGELAPGLHAGFCGTGSPMTDPQRAGPCFAVVAGDRLFVVDSGANSPETLALMGLPPARIEAVLLTHFHSDHIDGLGELALQRWASGAAEAPLPLYGTVGVERVAAGFNEAYAIDSTYRVAHHGADIVPPSGFGYAARPFTIPEGQDGVVILDEGGLVITAFHVDHGPIREAVGYRFDYGGRSLAVSGDTKKCACIARAAAGVDLLVHEALSPRLVGMLETGARNAGRENLAHILHDILDYHATPEDAADIATEARAGALALTHLIPPMPLRTLEGPFLGDARRRFGGPLFVTRDGDIISLPSAGGLTRANHKRGF